MTSLEFQEWPKIARLNREAVITEKIDGTNAAVLIVPVEDVAVDEQDLALNYPDNVLTRVGGFLVGAQSRSRVITRTTDNAGFAKWVEENAEALVAALGKGRHFGEWWGSGIQRGYGLAKGEKRFSLFNTERYKNLDLSALPNVSTVPVLYRGLFSSEAVETGLWLLREFGSSAAPGFKKPEGVVVFHTAAQTAFKVTLEKDEKPKGQA